MVSHNLKSEKGFNLIELMIVVAIIGILAAVAMPSYLSHIRKAAQVDGINRLLDIKTAQEKYYALNDTYYGPEADLSGADAEFKRMLNFDADTTTVFLFAITAADAVGFTVESKNDINEDGTRKDCWQITNAMSEPTQITAAPCETDGEGINVSLF